MILAIILSQKKDRCVTIETWERNAFFDEARESFFLSMRASGSHETCEFTLSREAIRISLFVIVVESGMRCDERTGALALTPFTCPGNLQTSSSAFLTAGR